MKNTKRALITSTLSLILCIAMLLGTTYAWFTDSVTSGKNKIVAGNLDVELKHYTNDATKAEPVQDATDLFGVALWEPGVIAYENFTVSNIGDLALKYALNLNVFDKNATTAGHDLTEVIKVAVIENGFSGDRAAAHDLTYGTLKDFQKTGKLAAKDTTGKTFGVVLYWEPTDNDNLYNLQNGLKSNDNKPLFVEFGVNLVATQDTVEKDSFDDKYDEQATLPEVASAKATASDGEPTVFTLNATPSDDPANGKTIVSFESGALTNGEKYELTATTNNLLASSANFKVESKTGAASVDLVLTNSAGNKVETFGGKKVTITTYVAKGLENVILKGPEGAHCTLKSYEDSTGKLVFETDHFSLYLLGTTSTAYVAKNDTAYPTLTAALEAADKGIVLMLNSVNENVTVAEGKDITLDLNKNVLNGGTGANSPALTNKGTVVVKNGTVKRNDTISSSNWYYTIVNEGTMTFEKGVKVTNDSGTINCNAGASLIRNYGLMNVKDGSFTQERYQVFRNGMNVAETGKTGAVINISGGVIDGAYCLQNHETANISGGDIHGTLVLDKVGSEKSLTNITGGYLSHPSTGDGTLNLTGGHVKSLTPADGYHLAYSDVDSEGYYPVVPGAVKNISIYLSGLTTKFSTLADAILFQKADETFGTIAIQMKDSVTETITLGDGTPYITFGDVPNGSAEITFVFKKGDTLKLGQTRMTELFDATYFDVDGTPGQNTSFPGYPHYYYNGKTITAKQDVKLTLTSETFSGTYTSKTPFTVTLYTAAYTPAN